MTPPYMCPSIIAFPSYLPYLGIRSACLLLNKLLHEPKIKTKIRKGFFSPFFYLIEICMYALTEVFENPIISRG